MSAITESQSIDSLKFILFLLDKLDDLVPIEGVLHLQIFSNGKKTILLMGETHQQPNYKSGCKLIINSLNTLFTANKKLKEKFNIDFFVEEENNPVLSSIIQNALYDNQSKTGKTKSNTTDDELKRLQIQNYINPKRGSLTKIDTRNQYQMEQIRRWIEPCIMNREDWGKTASVAKKTEAAIVNSVLTNRVCFKDVRYHWIDFNPFSEQQSLVNIIMQLYYIKKTRGIQGIPEIHLSEKAMKDYMYIHPEQRILKKEDLIKILTTNQLIEKEARKSHIKMEFLIMNFLKMLEEFVDKGEHEWRNSLFICARFCIDAYTFCRLMKDEKSWYENMIIYAGAIHTHNLHNLLNSWNPKWHLGSVKSPSEHFVIIDEPFKISHKCIQIEHLRSIIKLQEEDKAAQREEAKSLELLPMLVYREDAKDAGRYKKKKSKRKHAHSRPHSHRRLRPRRPHRRSRRRPRNR